MRYLFLPILVFFLPLCWSKENVIDNRCRDESGATLDSLQGKVFFDPENKGDWRQAKLHDVLCEGSRIRVELYSRASISLPNGVVLRLDEGTVLSLNGIAPDQPTLLDMLKGFIHFISRTPRRLEVTSPIANAGPEGTEFAMRVNDTQASLWVYEGGVKFFNSKGSVSIKPGQGAQTLAGQAPRAQIDIRPQDAVNWALYYPPLLPYPDASAKIDADIRAAIQDFRHGRIDDALFRLDALAPEQRSPFFHKVRGAMRLTAGRVDLAELDIGAILANKPNDAEALALQSVLALTQNRKDEALQLAKKALTSDPASPTAYSALSYAEQGRFELDKALVAADQATKFAPHDAMVWARKAELEFSKGLTRNSQKAAQRALELDAGLERTQTVTGFSYLLRMEADDAKEAFERAIQLDSASPLARLGLGLAKIRNGDLEEGRRDLEIAAILDPNDSIVRSYLGKAYYEEKRSALAQDQFDLAKERDPKDPTPYFYDALKKQTENRPVEALHDLQKAISLNDNRAVYRSKQLLDSDRAARGASLARIYDDLGFEQRGVVEAISSLQLDPTNFSAHRFLSDTYVNQVGRETAQLSELLQAKMLQPININPVQPHLSVAQRGLLNASGIANSSFQDFTRVFEGNRPQLLVSGVAGNQGILGDEATLSGIFDKFSYSLGQYHYEWDGFTRPYGPTKDRNNTDQRHDIYDAFLQWAINSRFNSQFEIVYRETEQGDFRQDLSSENISYSERDKLRDVIYRAGINLTVFTADHLLFSYIHNDNFIHRDDLGSLPVLSGKSTTDLINNNDFIEGQFLHNSPLYNLVTGANFYSIKEKEHQIDITDVTDITNRIIPGDNNGRNGHSEYIYINLKLPSGIIGTLGLTYTENFASSFENFPKSNLFPKIGLLWNVGKKAKIRLAYFKGNKRPLAPLESLEPTQIAGFNQVFDDFAGNYFTLYGGAFDLIFTPHLFSGLEFSQREVHHTNGGTLFSKKDLYKAYINWSLLDQVSISAQYRYTKNNYPNEFNPKVLSSHTVPLELRYFDRSGFFSKVTGMYINQATTEENISSSRILLLDAAIGFRLPKRYGILSFEVKNLLNKKFRYDDLSRSDESNIFFNSSEIIPQRTIFGRVTFNY